MRPRVKVLSALMLSSLLAGCATAPPAPYEVVNSRYYPLRKDEAYDRALALSARKSYYVTTSDRRNGVLNLERALGAPARTGSVYDWADCGLVSLLEQPVSQLVELSFVIQPSGPGSVVTINTKFSEVRSGVDHSTRRVLCTTTGQLEHELMSLLGR